MQGVQEEAFSLRRGASPQQQTSLERWYNQGCFKRVASTSPGPQADYDALRKRRTPLQNRQLQIAVRRERIVGLEGVVRGTHRLQKVRVRIARKPRCDQVHSTRP